MSSTSELTARKYDILIIGAGLSGLCSLYHMRQRFPQWTIGILEAADEVGGTWYTNSYPGARFDSESLSYGFSFDQELLDEWHWKEAFSPQPETLKYIQHFTAKHDLRKDIKFDTTVSSALWRDESRTWLFTDERGQEYATRFFVSCIGFLSAPTLPAIPGIESFKGPSFHTSRWPKSFHLEHDFAGKRIGVIGTGATGIQTITAVAKSPTIASLSVFQRTANWSAPLRNFKITPAQMDVYRTEYSDLFKRCAETPACFIHAADPRKSLDVSEADRLVLWEQLYAKSGFGKWLSVFSDTYTNREANELYSKWMAAKIRERINDPVVAERLIPKSHGFGTRRVPLESGYFEVYNQPNVRLVDLNETPIKKVNETGIVTSDGEVHDLDVLIYATGFDAITGPFGAINWSAKDCRPLLGRSDDPGGSRAIWVNHAPRTYLGLTAPALPNTFFVLGPHQVLGNTPRSIEHAVAVITDLLEFCQQGGYTYVEPTEQAVDAWTKHVYESSKGALSNDVDSWTTGVNKNVKAKEGLGRTVVRYAGNAVEYRRKCQACKESGWEGLTFA